MRMLVAQSSGIGFGDNRTFNVLPPAARNEMMNLRRAAKTRAIQRAFWFGAGFSPLGFGEVPFLPRRPKKED